MTVDQPFADNIVRHNGYYNGETDNSFGDNPRCIKIVKYTNAWGKPVFGLVMENENADPNRYNIETEFVNDPVTYWVYKA